MQITVHDIKKITINEGETLLIEVDPTQFQSPQRVKQVMNEAVTLFRQCFPNPKIGIVAVCKSTLNLSVVQAGQPIPGTTTNTSDPGSVNDAYDRAMKGLG